MERALKMLDLPLDGTHHRGIDDAKNISKIFRQNIRALRYTARYAKITINKGAECHRLPAQHLGGKPPR